MMPSDEGIINWAVIDSEVFWIELVDDWLDDGELIDEFEEWDENLQEESDKFDEYEEEGFDWDEAVDVDVM